VVFTKVDKQNVVLSYQCYSNEDKCILWGIDINPTGYSGNKIYLRLLTDQLK